MSDLTLGVFANRDSADNAVEELSRAGFSAQDISIITKDTEELRAVREGKDSQVAEGAVAGAGTGTAIGGIAGFLIGVGILTIPGIGPLLIGGPLAAALGLTGVAAVTAEGALTGALAGGLVGGLVGLGTPPDVAQEYENRVKEGAILVAVSNKKGKEENIQSILSNNGADQIRNIGGGDK